MVGVIGMRLNEGNIKINGDTPPTGIVVDLKVNDFAKTNQEGVATIKFSYVIIYSPNSALVQFFGEALVAEEASELEKLLKHWKEKNKHDDDSAEIILNAINAFVGLNALFVLRAFNLPPHIAPPPIFASSGKEKAKKKK
ncbi:Uncharacterised protein [uncultured archaeon]|nr:Uncharacterised protein [uncultured archaeon]